MDSDEEDSHPRDRRDRPSSRRKHDDNDEDLEESGAAVADGEEDDDRIVELVSRPSVEPPLAAASSEAAGLSSSPFDPLPSSSLHPLPSLRRSFVAAIADTSTANEADPDEPPTQRRRLNPNESRPFARQKSGRRVGFAGLAEKNNRRSDPNGAGPSRRFEPSQAPPEAPVLIDVSGSPAASRRIEAGDAAAQSRRDPLPVDAEPLIVIDQDGPDPPGGSGNDAAAPLDLRRELIREFPNMGQQPMFFAGNRLQSAQPPPPPQPHRVHILQDEIEDDEEEEEVETVEDSAPEDEGDPPPGEADVSDEYSDEEDVESDAATAGSSLSEIRERSLGSLAPLVGLQSRPHGKSSPSMNVRNSNTALIPLAASPPGPVAGVAAAIGGGSGAPTVSSPNPDAPSVSGAEAHSGPEPGVDRSASDGGRAESNEASQRSSERPTAEESRSLAVSAVFQPSPPEESSSPGRFEEKLNHGNHCPRLLQGLLSLRQSQVLCDFTLVADGQHFPVHKAVLCACSDYFRAMFTQNLVESRSDSVELQGVTSAGLRVLLDYVYTGELTVSLDSVAEIVGAATHLQVLEVVKMCSSYLKRHLGLDNCVDVLALAELYSLARLKEHALQFLCLHLQDFISEDTEEGSAQQLQRLTHEQLDVILKSDSLQVEKEVEVFQVAVRWLRFAWDERRCHAAALMDCVRFPLMTGEELVDVVEKQDFMSSDAQCHKLILEAYQYAILPSRQHLMQTSRTQVRASPSLVVLGGPWDFVPVFPFPSGSRTNVSSRCGVQPLQWQQGHGTMVYKTNGAGIASLDNYIFLIGGQISQEDRSKSGACYRYDPRTRKWLTLRPMNRARAFLAVAVKDKKIFAIGGQGRGSRPKSSCEVYDSVSGEWSPMATLPHYALLASACTYRDTVYVSGGHPDAGILKLTDDNTWETITNLPEARYRHTMIGAGSSLYIIGGRSIKHVGGRRQYPVPSAIVAYNLDTAAWSSFSLQQGPSLPLDPGSGLPPFDQANGANRPNLFSHPLLKAFNVKNSLYVVTKDSIYRSSGFPSAAGLSKWKFVASNPQTFTADMAFCLVPLPTTSFVENANAASSGSNSTPTSLFGAAAALVFGPNGRVPGGVRQHLRNQVGNEGHRRGNARGPDGHDEEIFINWEVLEG